MAFDTSLLDQALVQRRADYERERQEMLARVQSLLDRLGPRYGIRRAFMLGSLIVPGRFNEHSDVDIAVEQINPAQFFDAIGEFSAALGRDVDLIELDRCPFAHRIRENGTLWTSAV